MATGAWTMTDEDPACPFCAITHGSAPGENGIVYADDLVVAFLDKRPLFPGHVLVAPRRHVPTLADLPDADLAPLLRVVRTLTLAVRLALDADGSFVAVNDRVSQSVAHLHVHVVPRRYHDGLRGFFWPRHTYASEEEREAVRAAIAGAMARLAGSASPVSGASFSDGLG